MKWESLSAFISMGGYGFYVWSSYGVALLCVVGEVFLVKRRLGTLHKQLDLNKKSSV
ncbi:MAG: heme exporter protein CcmD [Nitrosomonas sp.]|nr:heme exporter protein CcmD [Nitrosomonas sp.]